MAGAVVLILILYVWAMALGELFAAAVARKARA